jgi:hypothetical protein
MTTGSGPEPEQFGCTLPQAGSSASTRSIRVTASGSMVASGLTSRMASASGPTDADVHRTAEAPVLREPDEGERMPTSALLAAPRPGHRVVITRVVEHDDLERIVLDTSSERRQRSMSAAESQVTTSAVTLRMSVTAPGERAQRGPSVTPDRLAPGRDT